MSKPLEREPVVALSVLRDVKRRPVTAQWLLDHPDEQGYRYDHSAAGYRLDPWIEITGVDAYTGGDTSIILDHGRASSVDVEPDFVVYVRDSGAVAIAPPREIAGGPAKVPALQRPATPAVVTPAEDAPKQPEGLASPRRTNRGAAEKHSFMTLEDARRLVNRTRGKSFFVWITTRVYPPDAAEGMAYSTGSYLPVSARQLMDHIGDLAQPRHTKSGQLVRCHESSECIFFGS